MKKNPKTGVGVVIAYCGHDAEFICDITQVGTALVIKANTENVEKKLKRPIKNATHHLSDHLGGFFDPKHGIFVVEDKAVTLLKKKG